jgi:hypothetical protein
MISSAENFESADRVAKVKQKIGSETTVRLRSGNFFMASPRYANRALRDTAFLFSNGQNAIAALLSGNVWLRHASELFSVNVSVL